MSECVKLSTRESSKGSKLNLSDILIIGGGTMLLYVGVAVLILWERGYFDGR